MNEESTTQPADQLISKLIDRTNALEAICIDLLTKTGYSAAQSRIVFDNYQIKYTQEAVDKREAETKAKELKNNYSTAVAEFKEVAKSNYWTQVFMSKKEVSSHLDVIWSQAIEGLELPEGAKRPLYEVPEPSIDMLIERRKELMRSIESNNKALLDETIKHCEQSIIDVTKSLEKYRDSEIAKLRKDVDKSPSERSKSIKELENDVAQRIRKNLVEQRRRITSSKVSLARLESDQDQLKDVNKMLGNVLSATK